MALDKTLPVRHTIDMTIRQMLYGALPCVVALGLVAASAAPSDAEELRYLRDAETETYFQEFAAPIFAQAGIDPSSVNFILVNSPMVNAFVAGGMNMYITSGLIADTKSVEELIGVMAHETGHISGGHLVRTQEAAEGATASALVTTLAGIAAAVIAKDGAAGAAAVSLGQQVAQRDFLSYSRMQESAADQAALTYLAGSRISADGMLTFLRRLEDEELLPDSQQSAFVRTHPLTRDRVDSVAAAIDRERTEGKAGSRAPTVMQAHYEAMKAKLQGYLDPRGTLRKVSATSTTVPDMYARAVALHMTGDTASALSLASRLVTADPSNPYFQELQGQILYETGKVTDAIAPYRLAVKQSGGNNLLRVGLAQALMGGTTSQANLQEAQTELEKALSDERRNPQLWRLLATAYGRQNQIGLATYALAEEAFVKGNMRDAENQAKRAQAQLEPTSTGWRKAQDLLTLINDQKKPEFMPSGGN